METILGYTAVVGAAGWVLSTIGGGSIVAGAVQVAITAASIAYSVAQQRKAKKKAAAMQMEAAKRAAAIKTALSRSQVATPGHHFALEAGAFSQYNSASTNFRDSIAPRRIVYGTRKLGGPILFAHNTNNTTLRMVIALASHEVEEVGKVYTGKSEVTLSGSSGTGKWATYVFVNKFTGTSTQNIGTTLIAMGCKNVKTSDQWKGIAALVVSTVRFSQKFDGSPEFSAIVKGKNNIFDPRDDQRKWTDNSALIVADYLHTYMGVSYDDINTAALIKAANICDEEVALKVDEGQPAATEKRYTTNAAILHTQDHERTLNDLVGAMAGSLAMVGGEWIISAGKPVAPTVELTLDDIIEGLEVTLAKSQIGQPEGIKGTYQAPVGNWEPATYPARTVANQPATSITNWLQLDLPCTTSAALAQRLAKIEFLKQRLDKSLTVTTNAKGLVAVPGDVVSLHVPQLGWEPKLFEVLSVAPDFSVEAGGAQLICNLELTEYDAAVFDWDKEELPAESAEVVLPGVKDDSPLDLSIRMTKAPVVEGTNIVTNFSWSWGDPSVSALTLNTIELDWKITVTLDNNAIVDILGTSSIVPGQQVEDTVDSVALPVGRTVAYWTWITYRARARYSSSYNSAWVDADLS